MARGKDSSAILGEADGGFLTEEQERRAKDSLREREAEDRKAEREQAKEHERRQDKERRQVPRGAGIGGRGSAGGGMSPVDIEKVRQPGKVKFAKGGSVKSSASKRADGCAVKGKTKGKMV